VELKIGVLTNQILGMSGFKFSICLIILAVLLFLSGFLIGRGTISNNPESYLHALSIYTEEGDTLLELDTKSECIKIWIEDSCEVDVWTLEENGWRRR